MRNQHTTIRRRVNSAHSAPGYQHAGAGLLLLTTSLARGFFAARPHGHPFPNGRARFARLRLLLSQCCGRDFFRILVWPPLTSH